MKLVTGLLCLLLMPLAYAAGEWDKAEYTLDDPREIKVYRSPNCQCCHKWIAHLEKHNFKVIDLLTEEMSTVKESAGLPEKMASCHTALIDGYIIEGHVPADDIKRLLTEKPAIKGLSVPQMPVGTPGMEMGMRKDNFAVFQFDQDNNYQVFNYYQVGSDQLYHSNITEE